MLSPVSNHKSNCNALNKQHSSEVAVFNMFLYVARVYMTARSLGMFLGVRALFETAKYAKYSAYLLFY